MNPDKVLALLGDELYGACKRRSDEQQTIEVLLKGRSDQQRRVGVLLDTRVEPTGSNSSAILDTVLRLAAQHENADVVALCLIRGAIVGEFVMVSVGLCGSFASHEVMIAAKAVSIHYCTEYCGNMLTNAVTLNHLKWAEFCLEKGAIPDNSYVCFYIPVIAAAAEEGFRDMVELLLKFNAKLRGSGAISMAAGAGQIEMVQLLLTKGADVDEGGPKNFEDEFDEYGIHEDVDTPLHRTIVNGHVDIAMLLIEAHADLARKNWYRRTPEMLARKYGRTEILDELQKRSSRSTHPEPLKRVSNRKRQKKI